MTEAEAGQYGGDLDVWLKEHAADVLHALLVLARAWVIADMPLSGHVFRNYTRWAQICGGLLEYHGIGDGFLANRDQVPDTDAEVWGPFLAQWKKIFPRPVKVRDLLEEDRLADVMPIERDGARSVNEDDLWGTPEPTQSELSKLGGELRARRGRWFADPDRPGWYLAPQSKRDKHSKANVWFVESQGPDETKAHRSPRSPRKGPAGPMNHTRE